MKKVKIFSFLVVILCLVSFPVSIIDAEAIVPLNGVSSYSFDEYSPYTIVQGDTVLYFNSIEDCNRYKERHSSSDSMLEPRYGEGEIVKIIDTETKNMVWIGYHSLTPSWSKASSYRCDASSTYSASGSYKWDDFTFNTGFSYTNTVAITYPADSNKWSRLGSWGDFYFEKHKVTETSTTF